MRDPHVQALYYRLESGPTEDFSVSPEIDAATEEFELRLFENELTATPRKHYSSREEAREDLDPHLRDWEVSALLDGHEIRFEYERSEMTDRDPLPGSNSVFAEAIVSSSGVATPTVIRRNPAYPEFPDVFKQTALTRDLIDRFRRYLSKNESLTASAYWMLTRLESEFGSRAEAGLKLHVSQQILKTLGNLSSRADPEKGRKAKGESLRLTPFEERWLQATMRCLIRRTGELTVTQLSEIVMSDLPSLNEPTP